VVVAVAILVLLGLLYYYRPTTVPNVRLKPVAEAAVLLDQAGLGLGESSEVATQSVGEGLVAGQTPAAGSSVRRHSEVDVVVAVQPTAASVPSVVDKEAALAEDTLAAELYVPVQVEIFGTSTPQGTVIGQFPKAGAVWTTGRPVAFSVAAGADDGTGVKVPSLEGKTLDAAVADVQAAGLAPYAVVRDLAQAELNEVVAQLPAAGAVVRPGQTILLYLELP